MGPGAPSIRLLLTVVSRCPGPRGVFVREVEPEPFSLRRSGHRGPAARP